jgi:hypothetical protein
MIAPAKKATAATIQSFGCIRLMKSISVLPVVCYRCTTAEAQLQGRLRGFRRGVADVKDMLDGRGAPSPEVAPPHLHRSSPHEGFPA